MTVSAVPDSQSGEVGGIQNTVTNLGASIGTALAGTVLIGVLTTTFLGAVAANPAMPDELSSRAQVELSAGVPFVSDAELGAALEHAGVPTSPLRRSWTTTRPAASTGCGPRWPSWHSSRSWRCC